MEKNLTEGSVLKNVVLFSLPYLLSYFLQTLYGMADLYIIGLYGQTADTTAVSIGSQVMHMLTVMIVGLAMGTTVMVARSVGAKDKEGAAKSVGATVTLFSVVALALTIVLLFSAEGIAKIMSTPSEAFSGTVSYLMICFAGVPFITAYNIISSVFRGMGDSKSPMYFIAVSCVINILLDFLFMGALSMGPAGAALGTTLSQTASVIIAFIAMKKRGTGIKIKKTDLKCGETMKKILSVGIPISLQDGFIQIAFIVITVFANRRGLNDAAAVGIVEKVISIFFLVPSTLLSAVSALAAQNLGAGKAERAKKTLRYAVFAGLIFGVSVSAITEFTAPGIVRVFARDSAVVKHGAEYLRSYVWDSALAGVHFCFSGYFSALGKSKISFFHNIIAVVTARIPIAYFASVRYPDTLFPMGFAAPVGSAVSVVICVAAYIYLSKKEKEFTEDENGTAF